MFGPGMEEKLSEGRRLIELFTSPTRCRGSYEEEAALKAGLEGLKLKPKELKRLRLRLPVNETGTGTYAARISRVKALLEDMED